MTRVEIPDSPHPPADWLREHTGVGSKASAGFGWQAGWQAGYAAALVDLGDIPEHIIELRDDGWTIKHPLACRPDLFNCPVNRAAEADLTEPPKGRGLFPIRLDERGHIAMGGPIRGGRS